MASIDMLREVGEAFKSSNITTCELFYSGGIRRGTDVLKALAYGAKGVFLDTESIIWALAHE
jgi:isopentenyl diphosphate isomerase/L-lactate dehydrogenase-like FMN-dependent dehydrogenase